MERKTSQGMSRKVPALPAMAPSTDSKSQGAFSRGLAMLPGRSGKAKQEALAARSALEAAEATVAELEAQLITANEDARRMGMEAQETKSTLEETISLLEEELEQAKQELSQRAERAEAQCGRLTQELSSEKEASERAREEAQGAAVVANERLSKMEVQRKEAEQRALTAESKIDLLEEELSRERASRQAALAEAKQSSAAELAATRDEAARKLDALAAELDAAQLSAQEATRAAATVLDSEREASRRALADAEAGAIAQVASVASLHEAALAAAQAETATLKARLQAAEAELTARRQELNQQMQLTKAEVAKPRSTSEGDTAQKSILADRAANLEVELARVRTRYEEQLTASQQEMEAARAAAESSRAALSGQLEVQRSKLEAMAHELELARKEADSARAAAAELQMQSDSAKLAARSVATLRDDSAAAIAREELAALAEAKRSLEDEILGLQQTLQQERKAAREASAAAAAKLLAETDAAETATSRASAAEREARKYAADLAKLQQANCSLTAEKAALEQELAAMRASTSAIQVTASSQSDPNLASVRCELEAQLADAREAGRDAIMMVCRHILRAEHAAETTLETLLQRAAIMAASAGESEGRRSTGKSGVSTHAAALFAEGKAANSAGDHWRASQLFEHAYIAHPRLAFLLSAANMYVKLHQPELAAAVYRYVTEHADASSNEKEMAERKLAEAETARKLLEDRLAKVLKTPVSLASAGKRMDAHESGSDDDDDDPFASEELILERRLSKRLAGFLVNGSTAGNDGSSASSLEKQLERAQIELRKATLAKAQALADKAAVERELAQQHKLNRRARASQLALQEVATALEVKLAAQAADAPAELRSGDEMMRVVLQEQAGQIVELQRRIEELEAQLKFHTGALDIDGSM
mmetsp:Transcript_1624/g.4231  ORF Transcript_1624/g.4231 Transcript_1624/m.4231 type:complete len:892 (-) Transcript_1624:239-2914(-)